MSNSANAIKTIEAFLEKIDILSILSEILKKLDESYESGSRMISHAAIFIIENYLCSGERSSKCRCVADLRFDVEKWIEFLNFISLTMSNGALTQFIASVLANKSEAYVENFMNLFINMTNNLVTSSRNSNLGDEGFMFGKLVLTEQEEDISYLP